jgi:replication factor C subunit 1
VLGDNAGPSKLAAIKKHNLKTLSEDEFLNLIATRKGPGNGKGLSEKEKKKKEIRRRKRSGIARRRWKRARRLPRWQGQVLLEGAQACFTWV